MVVSSNLTTGLVSNPPHIQESHVLNKLSKFIGILAVLGCLAKPASANNLTGQVIGPNTHAPVANGVLTLSLSQAGIVPGSFAVVPAPFECYTSSNGAIVGFPNPLVAPTVSAPGGGSITAGTYYVKVAYTDTTNDSLPSPGASVVRSTTGSIGVAAVALHPPTATGYKVYVGTVSGSEKYQSTVTGFGGTTVASYNAGGAALPTSNGSSCSISFNDQIIPSGTTYKVALTTSGGANVAGFPQTWYLEGTTVDVSNDPPLAATNTRATFPEPIVKNPSSNATQSINSPLDLNGYDIIDVGNLTMSGSLNPAALQNVEFCSSGSTMGAKITAAMAALPSTGGTVDCRNQEGSQVWSSDPFTGVTKPVELLLGATTITISANTIVVASVHVTTSKGSIMSPSGGVTLTFTQAPQLGIYQVFAGAGTIAGNFRAAYPEWWGVTAGQDASTSIQKAINLVNASGGGRVYCLYPPYTVTGSNGTVSLPATNASMPYSIELKADVKIIGPDRNHPTFIGNWTYRTTAVNTSQLIMFRLTDTPNGGSFYFENVEFQNSFIPVYHSGILSGHAYDIAFSGCGIWWISQQVERFIWDGVDGDMGAGLILGGWWITGGDYQSGGWVDKSAFHRISFIRSQLSWTATENSIDSFFNTNFYSDGTVDGVTVARTVPYRGIVGTAVFTVGARNRPSATNTVNDVFAYGTSRPVYQMGVEYADIVWNINLENVGYNDHLNASVMGVGTVDPWNGGKMAGAILGYSGSGASIIETVAAANLAAVKLVSTDTIGQCIGCLAPGAANPDIDNQPKMNTLNGAYLYALLDLSNAAAGQIKFPSSCNSTSDASTLDCYKEGTWTPSFTNLTVVAGGGSVTYTGFYTKIGRQVCAKWQISVTGGATTASTANSTTITNLPFAIDGSVNQWPFPVADSDVASLGNGLFYTSTTAYTPTWSARSKGIFGGGCYAAAN